MTPARSDPRAGFALPAMLALIVVIALVVGGVIETARRAQMRALDIQRRAVDFYAAEAGIAAAGDAIAAAVEAHAPLPAALALDVEGRRVETRIDSEQDRLDLNAASGEALTAAMVTSGANDRLAHDQAEAIVARRQATPWRSAFDLAGLPSIDDAAAACLADVMTPHGGATALREEITAQPPASLGVPYRIRAQVMTAGDRVAAVRAVIRLTGDPAHPMLVHEWRRTMEAATSQSAPCFPSTEAAS